MSQFKLDHPVALFWFVRQDVGHENVVGETVPPEAEEVGSHQNNYNLIDCLNDVGNTPILGDLFIAR